MGKSEIQLNVFLNVGHNGIEPLTSFLSGKRSTTELVTQVISFFYSEKYQVF